MIELIFIFYRILILLTVVTDVVYESLRKLLFCSYVVYYPCFGRSVVLFQKKLVYASALFQKTFSPKGISDLGTFPAFNTLFSIN